MSDQTTTIPKGWKMTTLGAVVEFQRGFDLPTQDRIKGNYPLIASTGIDGYVKEYKALAPGVVTGRSGSLGKVLFIKDNYWPLNTTLWIKDFKSNYEKFIYYWLLSFPFEKYNAGTGVPTLNRNHIHQVEVVLPENSEEQQAIAAVLSSLDDKIELLQEQNKTLEAIAQAIFKEWFVNFNFPGATGKMIDSELGEIPEEWKIEKLKDVVIENRRGISPHYSKSGVAVINQRCVRNGTITEEAIQFHNNEIQEAPTWFYLQPKDILINSMGVGTLGRVAQIFSKREKPYLIHSCITILRANKEIIDPIILGYNIKFLEDKIESMGAGTTGQTSLNNTLLGEMQIIIPDKRTQDQIIPALYYMSVKIDSNYTQIQTLSKLRDTLLPKLMKGEVRVKGFKD